MKSARNKTIDFPPEDGAEYLKSCLSVEAPISPALLENRVILGDAFTVLPLLPRSFVDLLVVDPPYNLDKDFAGSKFSKRDDDAYRDYTASWLEAVLPLLKPTASVYVCCDWRSSMVVGPVLAQYLNVHSRITWQREKGRGARANWKNGLEDIWFATVSDAYTFNLDAVKLRRKVVAPYRVDGQPKDWDETAEGKFRSTCPSNFWDDISIPYWSMAENTAHPTQKPEKLLAKLILASSNPDDFVFDPFLGSGTTVVTAKKLGRRFAGIEQSAQYCAWALKRLANAEHDRGIQGYADGVFWARNAAPAKRKNPAEPSE